MRKRFESLWAIRPEAVMTVVRLVARDMMGQGPMAIGTGNVVIQGTQWDATKPRSQGSGANKAMVIPIQGVLTQDGPSYYGTSYQSIGDAAEKAASDPDIKRIILAVDSPGGEVTGLAETAALLARVAKMKPVSAIVDGAAASAAYWLASQASDITLTPSGEVGSVGVRMMHVDMSKMLADEGYKVTELSAGDFKTEWSPYKPLTDAAKADMQTRIDASHDEFMRAISQGRGPRATAAIRGSKYGGGRMFSASEALRHGLVDRVQPTREAMRAVSPSFASAATSAANDAGDFGASVARKRLDIRRRLLSLTHQ